MKELTIIRGLPGSGKTTLARELTSTTDCWFEADTFFQTKGKYNFDIEFIKNAHGWCYHSTVLELFNNNSVVVSNTFTTYNEIEKYLKLLDKFPDLKIKVIQMSNNYGSIHNVPEETTDRMKNRWQDNLEISERYNKYNYSKNINYYDGIDNV